MADRFVAEHFTAAGKPKKAFENRATAIEAAMAQNRGRPGRSYHAYRCPVCRSWHIGRKPTPRRD